MTTHDPLCDSQPEYFDGSILWPEHCTCHIIVKVRADEREKAAQRVESCVNKFKARDFNDAVDACAAAVRGES